MAIGFIPAKENDTINVAYFLVKLSEKIVENNSCWEWSGCRNRDGYGSMGSGSINNRTGPRTELVHRVVYRLCVGPISPSEEVCHTCDNPSCCNPSHLFLGSHLDNMRDAKRKGRIKPRDSRGEKNPSAKLNAKKVLMIRERVIALGGHSSVYGLVAKEFNVSRATISRVVHKKVWGHVQ